MKFWTNIATASSLVPIEVLVQLASSKGAPIFEASGGDGQKLGEVVSCELRGEDLWAELEVPDDTPSYDRYPGIIGRKDDGTYILGAILATNLTGKEIAQAFSLRNNLN